MFVIRWTARHDRRATKWRAKMANQNAQDKHNESPSAIEKLERMPRVEPATLTKCKSVHLYDIRESEGV